MKTTRNILVAILLAIMLGSSSIFAQTAKVQLIHNSADEFTQMVDIYVNDALFIENFKFRTATKFFDVPAGADLKISVVGKSVDQINNKVWEQSVQFQRDEKYILIANGLTSETRYSPYMPFSVFPFAGARMQSVNADANEDGIQKFTDVLVFHGSTDAPAVNVVESGVGAGTIISNFTYGIYAGYLSLPTNDYTLQIRNTDETVVVAQYAAPLKTLGLENTALTVVASGFLNPSENGNGPAFGLYVALPSGGDLIPLPLVDAENRNTARVQVIHNSADAAAAVVDVWLNETKLIDNFAFRTATPFIDAPAGALLNIGIAPANSTSWTQSFKIKQVALTENETYVIVAGGIVSASGYTPAPAFDVKAYPIGREAASQPGNTDVLVVHGSTDAPTVDVYETGVGAGLIVDNLTYENVAGYLELATLDYILEVRDETGTVTVAAYSAPLQTLGLQGAALSVVASGFLNPANNSNGEAFGLYVALPSGGDLIPLPVYEPQQTARVQVIHNSADAAAAVVDVWLNDIKLIENFAFRTATPFIDAPAGVEFTIAIQGPGSTSPENPIWSQNYTLAAGETYVLVANGIVSATGYEPSQPFDIYVYAMGQESAMQSGNTDVLAFHGSTDAPKVTVYETGVGAGQIISDFDYSDFAGYLELLTQDYVLEVRDETGTVTVAAYSAPLQTLGLQGAALSVVASGFLNPANNSNGAPFGLYVALASGGNLIPLPIYEPAQTARVQVIHNSADAAAASVDVWLNDTKLIENFAFRTATPFIDAPAGVEFTIAIQGPGSTSPENPIWSQNYTLAAGETYVLVANGIVSASGYVPSQPFDIYVYGMGQEEAMQAGNTDVLAFHGSTDAPTVSVWETGVGAGQIISDFSYGDFAGYLELPTLDFVLEVRDATGTVTVAAYAAPLATLGLEGAALSVIASGFLNPANNSNGEAFGLYVALPSGGDLIALPVYTPTARVQVIHNSADAAAAVVDVWLDDTKLIENFAFRTATPFIDAPAGVEFTIAIQGPGSTSPANPIWSQNYTLADGETYVLVANGIVSASGYEPSQPFDIYVYGMGQEAAMQAGNTDVLAFHGSTDAPTVTVYETGVGAGQIISDFSYGDFAGYLELPTLDFVLEVRDETGTVTVAAYAAPLATLGLEGAALSVIASGFLNPANNSNGEAFGLYVALPSGGDLIALPVYTPTALVQVIHNSADAAAAVVDVWLNDTKLIENFAFRTATPFIDAPAGVEFTIAIQGPGSTSPANPIWSQNYTLADGETYVLVANGIVSATGYEPSQPFDIYVYPMGQESAMQSGNTDVLAFHGSTDAPKVTVYETGVGAGQIISDFDYSDFAGYLELLTQDYVLEVRDETGTVTVAAYSAPLQTLGLQGAALSVVASGFLNPANNSNGAPFGLYVALASGGNLIPLPIYEPAQTARVQVIHNSADAAAASVDVWLNDTKLIENFAFRTATPFVDAPAGVEFTIAIQGPGSTSPENPIWSQNYTLAANETYILIANGTVSPSGYDPVKPFNIDVYPTARETGTSAGNTDVLVYHGSTDAPTVTVWEVGVGAGQIVSNLSYTNFAGYLELPTANYSLQIRDETGTTAVATFGAPLETLGLQGKAITVLASGFLNPANNSDGSPFGLYVALETGGNLVPLTNTSSIESIVDVNSLTIYPNPVSSRVNVNISLKQDRNLEIGLYNLLGSKMVGETISERPGNYTHSINVDNLPEGLYIMVLSSGDERIARKVQIVR